jgi:hypothetical protein
MAFLSQFLGHDVVARLTDTQVDHLAEQVHFVMDREAFSNDKLKAAIDKNLKPAAEAIAAHH